MLRRKVAVLLMVCAAVCSGCGSDGPSDELMVTDNPEAAVAAGSPAAATTPAGTVTALADNVTATAFDPRSATLAVATKDTVRLYHLGDTLTPTHEVATPAESLTVDRGEFVAAGANK